MEASTAREFSEERAREVGQLVASMQQHVTNLDRWTAGQDNVDEFVADATREEMHQISGIYGRLVVSNESWTERTKQLEEAEAVCKRKSEELDAARESVAQKQKELETAIEAAKACGIVKEKELNMKIEDVSKQFSILENATAEQEKKKVEVEKQLEEQKCKVGELEKEAKERSATLSLQISILGTATTEAAKKKLEMEARLEEKSNRIGELQQLVRDKAEIERQSAEKDEKIAELKKTLKAQSDREMAAVAASLAAQEVEIEKRLRAEFHAEKEEWRNCREAGFAGSRDREVSRLEKVVGELEGFLAPGKMMLENDKKVEKGLQSVNTAIAEYEKSKARRDAQADILHRERQQQANKLREELGKIPEQDAFLDRRVAAINERIREFNQRSLSLDKREIEIFVELGRKAAEIPELGHAVHNFRNTAYGWNGKVMDALDGLTKQVSSLGDAVANLGQKRAGEELDDDGPERKRRESGRRTTHRPASRESFQYWPRHPASMAGDSWVGEEDARGQNLQLDEEEIGKQTEVPVKCRVDDAGAERVSSNRQADDGEARTAGEEAGRYSPTSLRGGGNQPYDDGEHVEDGVLVAVEGRVLQELRNSIHDSFAAICGSVELPNEWDLRRRVAFFDGLFEKGEQLHEKAKGSKKKGKKKGSKSFEPTTESWVALFDKGVSGTPQTHGGGPRVCFMALNGRLKAKFAVKVTNGNEVVENDKKYCATHQNIAVGNGQECVYVELAVGKDTHSDWEGTVKWVVKEHPNSP